MDLPPARPEFAPLHPLPAGMRLRLPARLRERLGSPFGPVFPADELPGRTDPNLPVAAVGDVCARAAAARLPNLHFVVVDLRTKRGPIAGDDPMRTWGDRAVRVASPPEVVTADLYNAVLDAAGARHRTRIVVDGEEDLAVLPAIMHMGPGATVIYGMPDRGVTAVRVDGESQRLARQFLQEFVVEREPGSGSA
ncbi:MAG TPA: DUF359 domain-containing protein [Candidatus Thermoplasmatota archaeon]